MPSTRTVLLVVAHSRSDRWPTTELYKRHFLGVLHMVSGKGCGKATAGVLCMHVASSPSRPARPHSCINASMDFGAW